MYQHVTLEMQSPALLKPLCASQSHAPVPTLRISSPTTSVFFMAAFLYCYAKHVPLTHTLLVFELPCNVYCHLLVRSTAWEVQLVPLCLLPFHSGSVPLCGLHTFSVLLCRDAWRPRVCCYKVLS